MVWAGESIYPTLIDIDKKHLDDLSCYDWPDELPDWAVMIPISPSIGLPTTLKQTLDFYDMQQERTEERDAKWKKINDIIAWPMLFIIKVFRLSRPLNFIVDVNYKITERVRKWLRGTGNTSQDA